MSINPIANNSPPPILTNQAALDSEIKIIQPDIINTELGNMPSNANELPPENPQNLTPITLLSLARLRTN